MKIFRNICMILLGFLLVAALPANAQIPTSGLAEQYDMVTTTGGGTTLVDLSGNGNNGTITGTTPLSTGLNFNGSSDWVSIPSVIGNSDFTVMECVSGNTNINTGLMFSDVRAADAGAGMVLTPQFGRFMTGASNFSTPNLVPTRYFDWDCYYETRAHSSVTYGILASNFAQTVNVGNVTIATGSSALAAQHFNSTTTNNFFAGTIGYVFVYTRALTPTELTSLYSSARATLTTRGVYMRDIVTAVYPGRVWQRQGKTGIAAVNQTMSYTTTDCVVIANPCFQLWYDPRPATTGTQYAEAPPFVGSNGLTVPGTWSVYGVTVTGETQGQVTKVTGFSYKYIMLASPAQNASKNAYTSPDPVHFTLAKTAALPVGISSAWDETINNSSIFQLGSTLYVAYDGNGNPSGGNTNFHCGLATSTDGLNWTKSPANPISGQVAGCGQPFLWNDAVTGEWYMWSYNTSAGLLRFQTSNPNSIWNGSSPSTVWGQTAYNSLLTFTPAAPDELNQLTCASLFQIGSVSYLSYCAADAGGSDFEAKLAIAPYSLHNVVQTGEGASTSNP